MAGRPAGHWYADTNIFRLRIDRNDGPVHDWYAAATNICLRRRTSYRLVRCFDQNLSAVTNQSTTSTLRTTISGLKFVRNRVPVVHWYAATTRVCPPQRTSARLNPERAPRHASQRIRERSERVDDPQAVTSSRDATLSSEACRGPDLAWSRAKVAQVRYYRKAYSLMGEVTHRESPTHLI